MKFIIARQEALNLSECPFSKWWYDETVDKAITRIISLYSMPCDIITADTKINRIKTKQKLPISSHLSVRRHTLKIDEKTYQSFYEIFCKKLLWLQLSEIFPFQPFCDQAWQAYKEVNKLFANKIAEKAQNYATIWLIDYPLMLVASYLRKLRPDLKIFYYHHYLFPDKKKYQNICKWKELRKSMLCSDHLIVRDENILAEFKLLNRINSVLKISALQDLSSIKFQNITKNKSPSPDFQKISVLPKQDSILVDSKSISNDKVIVLIISSYDQTWGLEAVLEVIRKLQKKDSQSKKDVLFMVMCQSNHPNFSAERTFKNKIDQLIGEVSGLAAQVEDTSIYYSCNCFNSSDRSSLFQMCDIFLDLQLPHAFYPYTAEASDHKNQHKFMIITSQYNPHLRATKADYIVNPFFTDNATSILKQAIDTRRKKHFKERTDRSA